MTCGTFFHFCITCHLTAQNIIIIYVPLINQFTLFRKHVSEVVQIHTTSFSYKIYKKIINYNVITTATFRDNSHFHIEI
jgi:hypothetical protein